MISFLLFLSFASAQITYPEVEALIKNQNIKSVEELLRALPTEYKTQYTLLKKSSALQEASLEDPRAVVYGADGTLTMTFNGDSMQGGYNDVEFLAYDKDQKEFELRVVTFANKEVVFSEKNPGHCVHCHGVNPRPLWDNYPTWKNSFGSKGDRLTPEEEKIISSNYFRENPRFKELIKANEELNYPFNAPATFGPNATLGKFYTDLQGEANVKRVLDSKGYKHSERLGLLALTDCPSDHYLLKIKELYPDQIPTLEWWIAKYEGEPFYPILLKSIYLFGIDYFQNNYFNLKMRYHEEHLSSDSAKSVRDATLKSLKPHIDPLKLCEELTTRP